MAHRRALFAVGCSIAAFAVLPAAYAQACSCTPTSTQRQFEEQPAAFTGRLLELRESSDGRGLVYRYRVTRDYKGNLRNRIRVRTSRYSSCEIPGRTIGNRYSMFLYRSDEAGGAAPTGPWTSNVCLQSTKAKLERAARRAASSASGDGDGGGDGAPQAPCSP